MANSVIGALRVMLGMDTAEFESGATRAQRSAQRFEKDMAKLGGKLQKIGTGMSIALTAPLTAFGVTAFKAASDAAELQSAFNQTFGELSGAMNDWAEQTGNAMGRSTQSMQQMANTFGIFFNQAAPTREEAAKMSQTFSVLAQDLASFYNVTEDDALAKLRSGLSGESEPLRDFGVFLSEAAVQAKALEMGLTGANNPLTEQEKIMARYRLILEATANAQGDVARTSDGTANQMRKAQAAFEELQVVVGTKLLPVLTPLIEKLAAALEWFTQLPEPVQTFAVVVGGLVAAVGPLLIGIGQIVTLAPAIATGFGIMKAAMLGLLTNPVFLGAAALVAGIYFAWKNWDKITEIVSRLYTGVKAWLVDKLGAVFNWLRDKILAVTGFFYDMYDAVVGNSYVPDMVDGIAAEFGRLQAVMVEPAKKAASDVTEATRQMAGEVLGLLDRLFPEMAKARQQAEELKLLDDAAGKGLISEDLRSKARLRVLGGGRDKATVSDDLLGTGPLVDVGKQLDEMQGRLGKAADTTKIQTVQIAESFRDMAERSTRALRGMVDAIKGGDWLDILTSAVDMFLQLASSGVFGKTLAGKVNAPRLPAFANGGAMRLGGVGGVDRNVLSLNGSPIARVSAGETMQIRPANDRGGGTKVVNNYYTLPSEEFWGQVDGRAAGIAAPIAQGTTTRAFGKARFASSKRLA